MFRVNNIFSHIFDKPIFCIFPVGHRLIESSRGLGAVVAALEAEAEAIFEVFSNIRNQRGRDELEQLRSQPRQGAVSGGSGGDGNTEGQEPGTSGEGL